MSAGEDDSRTTVVLQRSHAAEEGDQQQLDLEWSKVVVNNNSIGQ